MCVVKADEQRAPPLARTRTPYHIVNTEYDTGKDRVRPFASMTRTANETEAVDNIYCSLECSSRH